jgi:hypothetical protein
MIPPAIHSRRAVMSETAPHPNQGSTVRHVPNWTWLIPYLLAWGVFLAGEFFNAAKTPRPPTAVEWLMGADDRLLYLLLLLAAPFVWWAAGKAILRPGPFSRGLVRRAGALWDFLSAPSGDSPIRLILLSLLVAGVSLAASFGVGSRFDDLPPAYHDEYSYRFQAETFLAGRLFFPSHEVARLFDQMHVLNEGRFASRYFPGAGMWMTPFMAVGHPYWGHWLAGAVCAVLMFWIGRELAGEACGLIAGLLTALSPGMALFSNLLLAHHPTLVGLGIFILGVLRLMREDRVGWAIVSGGGLAFAMLCRPMTAAGVALPFGVYLLWQTRKQRLLSLAALGLPLVAAALGLFFYDRAITGNGWTTPYGLYTEIYTPRHVYGFNNVMRGEQHLGPRVIENYDKWAENLTPVLAARNVGKRLTASWKWTLGILPLTLALAGGLVLWRQLPRETWLILAGIVSLHAVHVPYWFAGMEDHHYVFESGPLWSLWIAVVSVAAVQAWCSIGRPPIGWGGGGTLVAAIVMKYTVSRQDGVDKPNEEPVWSAPMEQGIRRVSFARRQHGRFAALVARQALPHPALVLVDADPADRHIDYVINSPDLSGPVLIGHYLPDVVPLAEVKRLFPERALFLYRYRERDEEWRRLD